MNAKPSSKLPVGTSVLLAAALFGCAPKPTEAQPEPVPTVEKAAKSPASEKVKAIVNKLDEKIRGLGGTVGAAFVEVSASDPKGGAELGAIHEHDPKNPASNAKIPTVAAALSALGPGYKFATSVYGKPDAEGHIGDLVLRGHGDPTLRTEDLVAMARELRAAGVTKVDKVLVDQSYFDDKYVPPAFEQQPNEWAYFRAPVAALSLDENTVRIWVHPGEKGKSAAITVEPPGFVDVEGAIVSAKKTAHDSSTCEMAASGDHLKATLGGKVPEGMKTFAIVKRVDDPSRLAGYALIAALKAQGIDAGGAIGVGASGEKKALVTHLSRPLGEIVDLCGKESDNFVAEMLLRAAGEGESGSTSTQSGVDAVTQFLKSRDALDENDGAARMKIVNGSGLFDANRSTASGLTRLLSSIIVDPKIGPEFLSQLSIGGVDGTLKSRFSKWASARVIRAKTGTLAGTIALSGYILTSDPAHPIAFSILVNDVTGKQTEAKAAIDEAVEAVAALVSAS